jgi:hypothetical protein
MKKLEARIQKLEGGPRVRETVSRYLQPATRKLSTRNPKPPTCNPQLVTTIYA